MSKQARIRLWCGVTVLAVALVLLVASLLSGQSHPETDTAAKELGMRVEKRVNLLETYVQQALAATTSGAVPSSSGSGMPGGTPYRPCRP